MKTKFVVSLVYDVKVVVKAATAEEAARKAILGDGAPIDLPEPKVVAVEERG
jgi:hypothetical protein